MKKSETELLLEIDTLKAENRLLREQKNGKMAPGLQMVIDNTRDMIWVIDRDYCLVTCNKSYQKALVAAGGTEMALGQSVLSGEYPASFLDLWKKNYDRCLSGESFSFESPPEFMDGKQHVENSLSPCLDQNGAVLGAIVVARDISENKAVEKALKNSEKQFRILNEFMTDYVYKLSPQEDGKYKMSIIAGNYEQATGRISDEISSPEDWHKTIHPDDLPMIQKLFKTVIDQKKSVTTECRSFSADGISITGLDGTLIFISDNLVKWHGYDNAQEMIGRNALEFLDPAYHQQVRHYLDALLNGNYLGISDYEMMRKDGSRFFVEISAEMLKDKDGNPEGCFLIERDITERKKSEKALREINENLEQLVAERTNELNKLSNLNKAIINNSGVAIVFATKTGTIVLFNPAAEEMFGYHAAEVIGLPSPFIFFDPDEIHLKATEYGIIDDKDKFIDFEIYANYVIANRPHAFEWNLVRKDGIKIPVLLSLTQLENTEGQITGYVGFAIDITDRRKAEQELHLRESYLSAVISNHPGSFWMKDLQGKFLLVNDRNDQFLKFSLMDDLNMVIGKTDFDFMPLEDSNRYREEDLQVIQTRIPLVVEEQKILNNQSRWFEKYKFPIVDKHGDVIGVSAYSMDITNRKAFEQSLKESLDREKELNEMKSKFVSVASHEFRTPLATILATSESLLAYGDRMTKSQQNIRLEKIKDQVSHLNKIIEEVLYLSKLQAREVALEPELFDIVVLFGEIAENFWSRPGIGTRLDFNPGNKSIKVFLDKDQITHVLTNLLSNAFKYSNREDSVSLIIMQEQNHVRFLVKDHGIGIPDDELKHLFKPFYRASNAANISGTGLGLNIVKESVDRHGGSIKVESKINNGTIFTVDLPINIKNKT